MSASAPRCAAHHLRPQLLALCMATAFAQLATSPCAAGALPTGGKVVAGQASIGAPAGAALQVRQTSNNAAIDWQSFNIGTGESVVFQQPSAQAVVLNRVVGNDASQILGRLQANGQVFLVNPYGIVFGRDSRVDVAGLVASTANLRNDDLMAGRLRFSSAGRPDAAIANDGQITVREGGLAALMAPSVANRGTITARLGTVALASGTAFTIDPYGDRLVEWVVPASQVARVINSGVLSADGGSVQISARTAAAVVEGAINLGGTVRARSVGQLAGRIVLEGDAGTQVDVAGTLDASGMGNGEHGGSVHITGGAIRLDDGALVDARGDSGGGTALVGGDWHGAGSTGHVVSTAIAAGALVDVSAVGRGAGGEAVVWSDGTTSFDGTLLARGGAAGGDGGQAEVSGHRLGFDGHVDASAPRGTAGGLLLDPDSLVLQSRTTAAPSGAGASVVTTESIDAQLSAGTSVTLNAAQDITVVDRVDARLVNPQGVRIDHAGANLTLGAGGSLALDADVILDGGSFIGTAGTRITQAASGATLATLGGDVTLQAQQGIALQSAQSIRNMTLSTHAGSIDLATAVGLTGRFVADVMQAQPGDRVHLDGLVANAPDSGQPAVSIDRGAGNSGAAAVQIDDHIVAAGDVSIQGASVTLSSGKSIDTRAGSGGRAGSAITIDAGSGGIALAGGLYTDDAAIALHSQGDITQAAHADIVSTSGAITLASGGTTVVSQVQTGGALAVSGAQVVFDAGTTDTTVQAGTLQVEGTGSGADAVDIRSSIKLGTGDSSIASATGLTMAPGTSIAVGDSGTLSIQAAGGVVLEGLTSAGAGVAVQSVHGNVTMNQALGGPPAGDTSTVTTAGLDAVPTPSLYALDVRAPEGTISTKGMLLWGLKGAPLTIDMPAPGPLAYGLNLAAQEVDVRGLVFVLDGAVSIQGTRKLLLGNSIRSANGYAMSIGGGEIDVYRPTRPDGSDYKNTDIVVAVYPGPSVHFFELVNGAWSESTSFIAVVLPTDLSGSFWLDRTQAQGGLPVVSTSDSAFKVAGVAPTRLISLPDATPTGTNGFANNGGLESTDPTGHGLNPYVAMVYADSGSFTDAIPGSEVLAAASEAPGTPSVSVPGTRFVPKILVTNDPGAGTNSQGSSFQPTMVERNGVMTTNIGHLTLNGSVYETDSQGNRLIHDAQGSFESAGDLRDVAFKVATFDTRSIYQDSSILSMTGFGLSNTPSSICSAAPGSCLDDPTYQPQDPNIPGQVAFNDYPRIVYPNSFEPARPIDSGGGTTFNPVSHGFQAKGYLFTDCVGSGCERPAQLTTSAQFQAGEQPIPNANPNLPTSSLTWNGVQPGNLSFGRFEFLQTSSDVSSFGSGPLLLPSQGQAYINGLSDPVGLFGNTYKISVAATQATPLGTFAPFTPTRTVVTVSFGIIAGAGITESQDGTSQFKTALPSTAINSAGGVDAPRFAALVPALSAVDVTSPTLAIANTLPSAPVSASTPPPVTAPPPGDTGTSSGSGSLADGASANVLNALQTGLLSTSQPGADAAQPDDNPLLVLGGRGVAQSLDLGRSGGLGSARSASARVEYDVACLVDAPQRPTSDGAAPATRRERGLPPCR